MYTKYQENAKNKNGKKILKATTEKSITIWERTMNQRQLTFPQSVAYGEQWNITYNVLKKKKRILSQELYIQQL